MEHIDRLRFLTWRPEFVLTPAWTPFGRFVRFIQEEGGKAVLRERYLVTDAEPPGVENDENEESAVEESQVGEPEVENVDVEELDAEESESKESQTKEFRTEELEVEEPATEDSQAEDIEVENPEADSGWEQPEGGGEPVNYVWAKIQNDEEVKRIWSQLLTFRSYSEQIRSTGIPSTGNRSTEETEPRILFLESALHLFLDWYVRHGFPVPLEDEKHIVREKATVRAKVLRGHEHAQRAYEYLDQAKNMKELWRKMNDGNVKGYRAFMRAVGDEKSKFYPRGEEGTDEEKYEVFKERVWAYVDQLSS